MRLLISRYRITAAERVFLRSVGTAPKRAASSGPVILVEAVEDHYYLTLFSRIVGKIAAGRPVEVQQFIPRSLRPGCTRSLYQAFKAVCFYNLLTDRKWRRLYAAFCSRVAYKSAAPVISRACIADVIEARRIWKSIESKEMLVDLTISGVTVGDLVYDTYLRFKPAATLDFKSLYLWLVLWQTLRDLRASQAYMVEVKPRIFLATYSAYVQHGIAARVALAAGVRVFTFGNYQEFYKQLHPTDLVHTKNPDSYRSDFARLESPAPKIAEAERALSSRLSGKNDAATAYMQRSAYAGSAELPEGISGSLVLFLHDFFDSPHCYRWMIFPDFWEWATFTLDRAREAGIKTFVKPHPNQIVTSKAVVARLMSEYPEATWLSTSTSNVQLVEAGMACAVSIYGTVAHEMAFLGIPSIAAGHNPHISFSFCHTAQSRDEYRRLILDYQNLPRPAEQLKRESLEFYWMHNLAVTAEQARLNKSTIRFRTLITGKGGWLFDGADFVSFIEEITSEPAFNEACMTLAAYLDREPGNATPRKSMPIVRKRDAAVSG